MFFHLKGLFIVEIVWLDASTAGVDRRDTDAYARTDIGGGLEAGIEIPLGKKLGVFFDIAALGIIFSHLFESTVVFNSVY
jgi:uncharacterized protein YqgC (DUF456 family)